MKKTFLCLLCALFLLVFTSCDEATISDSGSEAAQIPVSGQVQDTLVTDSAEKAETDNTIKNTGNEFSNVVPENTSFSTDSITDIQVLDDSFYSVFTAVNPDDAEKPLFGVIDLDGNVIFGPVADYLFPCNGHKTIGIYADAEIENKYELPHYLGNGYYITEHGGHGGSDLVLYIYHEELERYYAVHQSEGGAYIARVYAVPDGTAFIVCEDTIKGVKKIEDPYTLFAGYLDEVGYWDHTAEEYNFNLSAADEKITLSGFEYVAPEFINGYLICKKDGKYGYINAIGEETTGFIFDEAKVPFYDKAWVKIDNKWQIIDLARFS